MPIAKNCTESKMASYLNDMKAKGKLKSKKK